MSRDGTRPPTSRSHRHDWLLRVDAGKPPTDPPPTGPKDTRPPRGPVQPTRPHPQDPDKLPEPRPGRVLAAITAGQTPPYPPGGPSPGPGPTGPGPTSPGGPTAPPRIEPDPEETR